MSGGTWTLADDCQIAPLGAHRVLVKHNEGSSVVDAPHALVAGFVEEARAHGAEAGLARVPAASREDAAALLRLLERPARPTRCRIGIVGSGPWSLTLRTLLARVLETSDRGVRVVLHEGTSDLSSAFDESDVVVCAVEDVTWERLATLNAAALRGRARATFALFHHGGFAVGPVVRRGRRPCLLCERIQELGREGDDPDLPALFGALRVDGGTGVDVEEAAGIVLGFVRQLVEDGPKALDRVHGVRNGARYARTVAPLPRCTGCAGSVDASAFRWTGEVDAETVQDGAFSAPATPRLYAALAQAGGSGIRHASGDLLDESTFLDHLRGVHRVLSVWGEAEAVCRAGLFHSVYGTSAFDAPLFGPEQRAMIRALIGPEAERLAFLFCTVDRDALATATRTLRNWRTGEELDVSTDTLRSLSVVAAANTAEQTYTPDGGPALWIAEVRERLAATCSGKRLPRPFESLALRLDDEADAIASYEEALTCGDTRRAIAGLERAGRLNPFVGEPLLLAAERCARIGDTHRAHELAKEARARLSASGVAWDKRRAYDEWLGATARLERTEVAA